MPIRKPDSIDFDPQQKSFNRTLSGLRAPGERVIEHLKNWKILATGYRRRLCDLQRVIHIITGLERFRVYYSAS